MSLSQVSYQPKLNPAQQGSVLLTTLPTRSKEKNANIAKRSMMVQKREKNKVKESKAMTFMLLDPCALTLSLKGKIDTGNGT